MILDIYLDITCPDVELFMGKGMDTRAGQGWDIGAKPHGQYCLLRLRQNTPCAGIPQSNLWRPMICNPGQVMFAKNNRHTKPRLAPLPLEWSGC